MKNFMKITKFHNDKGYSLIELVVVIAIMIAVVGVITPMLYNGPSNKTRQDVETFNSMIGKNSVNSMAKQNRALELGYDSTKNFYYVATGTLTTTGGAGSLNYTFTPDETRTFAEKDTVQYCYYSTHEPAHSGEYLKHTEAGSLMTLDPSQKMYFRLDKTKGNFKPVIITSSTGSPIVDEGANEYVKYVYFNYEEKATRGCRLYKDTGKHDVFKE